MIHLYKLAGKNIVLDVCSGSVHLVDEAAYDAIAALDGGASAEETAAMRPLMTPKNRESSAVPSRAPP